MKRDTFIVEYGSNPPLKAHSWNGALRKIEATARELARAEGCFYHLTETQSNKPEFTEGFRVWSNGVKSIRFTIRKVLSAE